MSQTTDRIRKWVHTKVSVAVPVSLGLITWVGMFQYTPESLYESASLSRYVVASLTALSVGLGVTLLREMLLLEDAEDATAQSSDGTRSKTPRIRVEAVVEQAIAAIREELGRSEKTGHFGWPHFIGVPRRYGQGVSALATAYGLKILMLGRQPEVSQITDLRQSLVRMQLPNGGWAATSQRDTPRPEVSATILSTLHRAGTPETELLPLVRIVEKLCTPAADPIGMERTHVVSVSLNGLLDVVPYSATTSYLLETICEAAVVDSELVYWTESANRKASRTLAASTVQTARCVLSLAKSRQLGLLADDDLGLLEAGTAYLAANADLSSTTEEIVRFGENGSGTFQEALVAKQFVAAWVVRALVAGGTPVGDKMVQSALDRVIRARQGSLWRWADGEYPIWMTYHGLVALQAAASV